MDCSWLVHVSTLTNVNEPYCKVLPLKITFLYIVVDAHFFFKLSFFV